MSKKDNEMTTYEEFDMFQKSREEVSTEASENVTMDTHLLRMTFSLS